MPINLRRSSSPRKLTQEEVERAIRSSVNGISIEMDHGFLPVQYEVQWLQSTNDPRPITRVNWVGSTEQRNHVTVGACELSYDALSVLFSGRFTPYDGYISINGVHHRLPIDFQIMEVEHQPTTQGFRLYFICPSLPLLTYSQGMQIPTYVLECRARDQIRSAARE